MTTSSSVAATTADFLGVVARVGIPAILTLFGAMILMSIAVVIRRVGLRRFIAGVSESSLEIVGSLTGFSVGAGPSTSSSLSVHAELARLAEVVEKSQRSTNTISSESEKKIVAIFEHALSKGLNEEISLALENLIASKINDNVALRTNGIISQMLDRLSQASRTASIRGFFNLAIGVGFAVTALLFLKSAVQLFSAEELTHLSMPEVIYSMGIRISLSLIITIIAYFFLSLYKRSLEDVKFYQNEMTDVSMKSVVVDIANNLNTDDAKQALATAIIRGPTQEGAASGEAAGTSKIVSVLLEKLVDKIPKIGN